MCRLFNSVQIGVCANVYEVLKFTNIVRLAIISRVWRWNRFGLAGIQGIDNLKWHELHPILKWLQSYDRSFEPSSSGSPFFTFPQL
jgi:hypothetical protein